MTLEVLHYVAVEEAEEVHDVVVEDGEDLEDVEEDDLHGRDLHLDPLKQ